MKKLNVIVLMFLFLGGMPGHAFVIAPTITNGTPNDSSDDLQSPPRWSFTQKSLVDDNVPGLGGGIEYSVSDSFCKKIRPRFEYENPTCEEIVQAIRNGFNEWARHNPVIKFTDVSDSMEVLRPPEDHERPWIGFGAEIDLLVMFPREFDKLEKRGAVTEFWYLFTNPKGPNGDTLPGKTLSSGDIIFNQSVCFYLEERPDDAGCNHFESLLIHEIGHTFGLHHPNQHPERNFVPRNESKKRLRLELQNYEENRAKLKLSEDYSEEAVMNSSLGEPHPRRPNLGLDDINALNFLYPSGRTSDN